MLPCGTVPRTKPAVLLAAVLAAGACDDYHLDGPVDPEPLNPPRLVTVTVEYLQPNECVAGSPRCDDPVVFFGSWMQAGQEFLLRPEPGRFVWRGTATNVPVNFPPRGAPHAVGGVDPPPGGRPAASARSGSSTSTRTAAAATRTDRGERCAAFPPRTRLTPRFGSEFLARR
jgi:hypothetical protein